MTPLQMARFYALIANGGKLVTPHVAVDVEQPGDAGQRRRSLRSLAPPPPRPIGVDPSRARGRPRRALPGDARRATARRPASSATSRSRSPARRARPRRSSTCPATTGSARPVVVVRLRARPTTPDDRRLRADRERRPRRRRGGAGGAAGLRAASSRRKAGVGQRGPVHRLMIERCRHRARAAGAAARRARRASARTSAGSTGCCSPRSAASSRYGLWAIGGITRHDVAGQPELLRRPPERLRRRRRRSGSSVAALRRPRPLPALLASAHLRRASSALMLLVLARRRRDARLAALDRPRLLPLPAVRVRQAAVRARAGRVPRRARPARARAADRAVTTSGSPRVPILLVFMQPDLGTALVYAAALGAVLFVGRRAAGRTSAGARRIVGARGGRRVLWFLPGAGVHVLKAVPDGAPDRVHASRRRTRAGRRTTSAQSITAVGVGRRRRPRRQRRDADEPRLPARAPHRLRLRRRSPSSAASSAAAILLLPLPARRLARAAGDRGRARRVLGDRGRRDRGRAALPDLRQRRDDDRDRADHRHPAAVRQRRRLVDDREPARDRRAPGDPRRAARRRARRPQACARSRGLHPFAVFGLASELRIAAAATCVRSSSAARRRWPQCSPRARPRAATRARCATAAVRTGGARSSTCSPALRRAEDARALRAATAPACRSSPSRPEPSGRPIPYVLADGRRRASRPARLPRRADRRARSPRGSERPGRARRAPARPPRGRRARRSSSRSRARTRSSARRSSFRGADMPGPDAEPDAPRPPARGGARARARAASARRSSLARRRRGFGFRTLARSCSARPGRAAGRSGRIAYTRHACPRRGRRQRYFAATAAGRRERALAGRARRDRPRPGPRDRCAGGGLDAACRSAEHTRLLHDRGGRRLVRVPRGHAGQTASRYREVEPWAWARLSQRLRAVRARRAKLRPRSRLTGAGDRDLRALLLACRSRLCQRFSHIPAARAPPASAGAACARAPQGDSFCHSLVPPEARADRGAGAAAAAAPAPQPEARDRRPAAAEPGRRGDTTSAEAPSRQPRRPRPQEARQRGRRGAGRRRSPSQASRAEKDEARRERKPSRAGRPRASSRAAAAARRRAARRCRPRSASCSSPSTSASSASPSSRTTASPRSTSSGPSSRSIAGNIYMGIVDNVLPGHGGGVRRDRPREERLPLRRRDRRPRARGQARTGTQDPGPDRAAARRSSSRPSRTR